MVAAHNVLFSWPHFMMLQKLHMVGGEVARLHVSNTNSSATRCHLWFPSDARLSTHRNQLSPWSWLTEIPYQRSFQPFSESLVEMSGFAASEFHGNLHAQTYNVQGFSPTHVHFPGK